MSRCARQLSEDSPAERVIWERVDCWPQDNHVASSALNLPASGVGEDMTRHPDGSLSSRGGFVHLDSASFIVMRRVSGYYLEPSEMPCGVNSV